jgi:hypothetical protein
MARKKKNAVRMVQKVVVNVAGGRKRNPARAPVRLVQPPQGQVAYNNPTLDVLAIRQATLQLQNLLRNNQTQDTIARTQIQTDRAPASAPTDPPVLRPLTLAPTFTAVRFDSSPHVRLPDQPTPYSPRTPSSSSSSSSTPSGDPYFTEKGPHTPRFVKSVAGSARVINPRTGREIGYRSKIYKQLVREGDFIDSQPPWAVDPEDEKED